MLRQYQMVATYPIRCFILSYRYIPVYIYDRACTSVSWLQLSLFKLMHRALSHGLGTGTSLALWWNLLGLDHPAPFLPYDLACPVPSVLDFHLPSLLLGILVGLFIGPLLEALVSLRVLIYHSALRRSSGFGEAETRPRPLYRIH